MNWKLVKLENLSSRQEKPPPKQAFPAFLYQHCDNPFQASSLALSRHKLLPQNIYKHKILCEDTYLYALTLSLSLRSERISLALMGTPAVDNLSSESEEKSD